MDIYKDPSNVWNKSEFFQRRATLSQSSMTSSGEGLSYEQLLEGYNQMKALYQTEHQQKEILETEVKQLKTPATKLEESPEDSDTITESLSGIQLLEQNKEK